MGYQRQKVFGTSPLDIKKVNDNFENVWNKLFGDVNFGDLDFKTKSLINSKITAADAELIVNAKADELTITISGIDNKVTSLTQNLDGFKMQIGQSGGYNHLKNGYFDNYMNKFSTWGSPVAMSAITNGTDSKKYVKLETNGTNQGFKQTVTDLVVGTKYTLSAKVAPEAGVVVGIQVYHNGKYSNAKTDGSSYKDGIISMTFTAEVTSAELQFGRGGFGTNGISRWHYVQLEQGELATAFSYNFNEINAGITNIDEDGVKVSHSQSETYTRMSSDGFKVYDNNDKELASFGDDNKAVINTLECNVVNSVTVIPQIRNKGTIDCYVAATATGDGSGKDQNNRSNSVIKAIKNIFNSYGLSWTYESGGILSNTEIVVHMWWGGMISENFEIKDFIGEGMLKFDVGYDMVVTGAWSFRNCRNVVITGQRTNGTTNNGALFQRNGAYDSFSFYNCNNVYIDKSRFFNTVTSNAAISARMGSNVYVSTCDFFQGGWAIWADTNSRIVSYDNRGHGFGSGSLRAGAGCIVIWEKAIPSGSVVSAAGGWGTKTTGEGAEPTVTNSVQVAPPAPTNKVFVQDFTPGTVFSVRSGSTTNGVLRQGAWSGTDYMGYCDFGNTVKDWLSNASGGVTMQVYLQRVSDAHGNYSPVPVIMSGNNVGTLTLGEGKWFTVPSSVVTTLQGGGDIMLNGSGSSQYIKFVDYNVTLRVTATKPA